MPPATPRRPRPRRPAQRRPPNARAGLLTTAGALLGTLAAVFALAGCAAGHPQPIAAAELAEAQTFPYYRVYWVGHSFDGNPLVSADGLHGYIEKIGTSVYYGDCVKSKGIFGGGSCELPLQVTTVVYRLHDNEALGPQSNILVRGVPAVVYDGGRSLEVYTGHVAIDVFSNSYAHALQATDELRPINAPASAGADLPLPVYCPGLSGPEPVPLAQVMDHLPGLACQRDVAQQAYDKSLYR